jgi:ribosome biogenesis GTPase
VYKIQKTLIPCNHEVLQAISTQLAAQIVTCYVSNDNHPLPKNLDEVFCMREQKPTSRTPQKYVSKSRRTAKTWAKESSRKQQYDNAKSYSEKRRYDVEDDEAVPLHAVSMTPRLRNIQTKHRLDTDGLLTGQVISSTGRSWIVSCEIAEGEDLSGLRVQYDCVTTRSMVTENPDSTLVAVGDVVSFKPDEISGEVEGLPTGAIMLVHERRTKLAREAAGRDGIEQVIVSNVDHLVILMAAAEPFYNRRLIDRYLIAAEQGELAPIICINKIDLMDEAFVRDDMAIYEQLGIPLYVVSAATGQGLASLAEALIGKVSVMSGPSGVGKSTLVNILLGEDLQATTNVSAKTQKGLHTTTFSELFALPHGGFLADTPGIREFGMWNLEREEVQFFFHEFDACRYECRFSACTHTHEPHCAVKAAVEEGAIDVQRYESYVNLLESLA